MQALRQLAFPEAAVFSDKLVSVCTTLARCDPANDPLREEPWQHVESCVASLQEGIGELRGMQTAIERHTRQQLAAATLKENLAVLFDQFAEHIGHACYAELVHARLPLRLAEARRRVEELEFDAELLGKMQAEVLRREPALAPETAMSRVRLRLEELADLLQSVVPVADAVDRRTAEFTRRSLARFRYLQETTSENRARVQEFFEALNRHFAGRGSRNSTTRGSNSRSFAFTTRGCSLAWNRSIRRGCAAPRERSSRSTTRRAGSQQDDAMRRLHAAMRDSLTVARANRFVEQILPGRPGEHALARNPAPMRGRHRRFHRLPFPRPCAADARSRIEVDRERTNVDAAAYVLEIELPHRTIHHLAEMAPAPTHRMNSCSPGFRTPTAIASAKPCAG